MSSTDISCGTRVQLVHATTHLGAARGPLFNDFITKCEVSAGAGEYYSYPALKTALSNFGLLPPLVPMPG